MRDRFEKSQSPLTSRRFFSGVKKIPSERAAFAVADQAALDFKMILRLVILLSISSILPSTAQKSFAATKFELNPELPWEEPVEVQEANDEKPVKIEKQVKKHRADQPVQAVPTVSVATPAPVQAPAPLATVGGRPQHIATPQVPAAQPGFPAQPVTPPPVFTFPTFAPPTPFGQPAFGQPGGFQPSQPGFTPPQPPQFAQQFAQPGQQVQQGFAQPQQPAQNFAQAPQGFPQGQQVQQPAQGFPQAQQVQPVFPQQIQAAGVPQAPVAQPNFPAESQQPRQVQPNPVPDSVQLVRAQSSRERVELWFREDYPDNVCKRDARELAEKFKLKFPANLWKNGKDLVLTDLLTARLGDCIQKQDADHWSRVNGLIHKLQVSPSEEEDCRSGLVQEQISCSNVLSYTCQFIQKPYIFRLVPARIIIQEARIAEDGAEKCRKIVRKVKKELQ
ncbi:unnamed protein product [Bursaphelenchus xylophilus]|uniref:(pine wood nematode) hypothetical protein n=1 Tax=Bursaphelenchus xylophilus TaxID=6326 RepID=A0A1I7SQE3_BURXY|nr:unnamed protein product [Bursaphelenchus xylophilus]CAG9109780.1 unnamed protein product [Bursaphelenchus xylophilus]